MPAPELPRGEEHPFYGRVNRVLEKEGFDAFVEEQCARFQTPVAGRRELAPGRYFRLLLIGYFEGLHSERGIAWRTADSLSLREFLRLRLADSVPDHSAISRTRRRIDVETHEAVHAWILERLRAADLLRGKPRGVEATTLAANTATGDAGQRKNAEDYREYLARLAAVLELSGPPGGWCETPAARWHCRTPRRRPRRSRATPTSRRGRCRPKTIRTIGA